MPAIHNRVYEIVGVKRKAKLPAFTSYGSYTLVYVTHRACRLCATCANNNRDNSDPVVDAGPYWEGPTINCDNCDCEIESSYGDW